MAIDPATAKLLAQAALKLATDEKARKRLFFIVLTPLFCVIFILTTFVYILTHPLEFLGEFFDSQAITEVEHLQNDYGMYQYLSAKDYENGVTSYEGVTFTSGATTVVYYNQGDERFRDKPYGTDNIGGYGCGPIAMAMVFNIGGVTMNNRKKLIELFIYVLIVVIRIILLFTTNFKKQENKPHDGGARNAVVSFK